MSNQDSNKVRWPRTSMVWLVLACLLVFLFWLFYPSVVTSFFLDAGVIEDGGVTLYQIKGLFGDQFGALSSLFSGLAFAGIIYTILLQRSDLISTRKEVARQNKLSEKQAFENTLFQMLFSRQDILKNLDILGNNGRKALDTLFKRIVLSNEDFPVYIALKSLRKDDVRKIKENRSLDGYEDCGLSESDISTILESFDMKRTSLDSYLDSDVEEHLTRLRIASKRAVLESMDEISHYLRYTFWIYKTIDSSDVLSDEERRNYSDIVRSQLSDVEIATIFYVVVVSDYSLGWSEEPVSLKEMKKLAIKYSIVENINDRFLIHGLHKKILRSDS